MIPVDEDGNPIVPQDPKSGINEITSNTTNFFQNNTVIVEQLNATQPQEVYKVKTSAQMSDLTMQILITIGVLCGIAVIVCIIATPFIYHTCLHLKERAAAFKVQSPKPKVVLDDPIDSEVEMQRAEKAYNEITLSNNSDQNPTPIAEQKGPIMPIIKLKKSRVYVSPYKTKLDRQKLMRLDTLIKNVDQMETERRSEIRKLYTNRSHVVKMNQKSDLTMIEGKADMTYQ